MIHRHFFRYYDHIKIVLFLCDESKYNEGKMYKKKLDGHAFRGKNLTLLVKHCRLEKQSKPSPNRSNREPSIQYVHKVISRFDHFQKIFKS